MPTDDLPPQSASAPGSEASDSKTRAARSESSGPAGEGRILQLEEAVYAAKDLIDFLRKNTGFSDEWAIEIKVAPDAIDEIQGLLNRFEKTVYAAMGGGGRSR